MDWFNAVDLTYQQQPRDLNQSNWQRFQSELHAAIAQWEARMTEKMAQMATRLTQKMADLETRMAQKVADLEARIADRHSGLMKWMFIYWPGTVLSIGALFIALLGK